VVLRVPIIKSAAALVTSQPNQRKSIVFLRQQNTKGNSTFRKHLDFTDEMNTANMVGFRLLFRTNENTLTAH